MPTYQLDKASADSPWTKVSEKLVYENNWVEMIEDKVIRPDGKPGVYGVLAVKRQGIRVIPVTSEGKIVLNYEYRYAAGKAGYELTAGGIEEGSDPLETAKKELFEETGLSAAKWTKLISVVLWPSVVKLTDHIFLAEDLSGELNNDHLEGDEGILRTESFSTDEVKRLIMDGKMFCGPSISGIFSYFIYKGLV